MDCSVIVSRSPLRRSSPDPLLLLESTLNGGNAAVALTPAHNGFSSLPTLEEASEGLAFSRPAVPVLAESVSRTRYSTVSSSHRQVSSKIMVSLSRPTLSIASTS